MTQSLCNEPVTVCHYVVCVTVSLSPAILFPLPSPMLVLSSPCSGLPTEAA